MWTFEWQYKGEWLTSSQKFDTFEAASKACVKWVQINLDNEFPCVAKVVKVETSS